ncbi:MAG: GMC family oxidoreductase N-terminal domain-containing protein [Planctomycetota bacterium]
MIYVVGSGPSGVSAAWALSGRGLAVTLLDAGLDLEPERAADVARLQGPPGAWPPEALERIKGRTAASPSGVSVKYVHGSDYPYRPVGPDPFELHGVATHRSFSRGGHSNVWGAAALPCRESDTRDWPVSVRELEPHYRAVLEFMPYAGADDDLSDLFPAASPTAPPLRASRQGQALLDDLRAAREPLRAAGFTCGAARLAVRTREGDAAGAACSYCGMCLFGCPSESIWSSRHALPALEARGVRYEPGQVVERLREGPAGVTLEVRDARDGRRRALAAERVFLAAGVLSTAAIALRSLTSLEGRRLTLRCSEYFLLPFLRYRGVGDVAQEEAHTLAQAYLELDDPAIDRHSVHLQLYGYNELYRRGLEAVLGPALGLLGAPTELALSRLHVIQGYLHSDVSSRVEARLLDDDRAEFRGVPNPLARQLARGVAFALLRHQRHLRGVPLLPLLSVGAPGAGSHLGSSFPMARAPRGLQSDLLGRPPGWERIHLIDASVLPAITSTTITFTTMANAHRIAAEAAERFCSPRTPLELASQEPQ